MNKRFNLRTALEDSENGKTADNLTVLMKGPLSDAYTQALAMAYSKVDPNTQQPVGNVVENNDVVVSPVNTPAKPTTPALESEQQETQLLSDLRESIASPEESLPEQYMTIYGVNKEAVTPEVIVEVTQLAANAKDPANVVLVIDSCGPGPNSNDTNLPKEKYELLGTALESIAEAYGIKTYPSLLAYAKTRKE